MTKKKTARAAAAPATPPQALAAVVASNWLVCRGYTLDVRNSGTAFVLRLDAQGHDGNPYFLNVVQLNDRTGLIQRVLRILAERWPAFDWEFQADAGGSITDIR